VCRSPSSRPRLSVLVAVAVAGVFGATAACQRDDSILLVEVAGDLTLMPAQLSVTVTANGSSRVLLVPPEPTTISLPTSFSVELDRSITGPVTIAIDALDDSGNVLDSAATTQTHINAGGQTIITVMFGVPVRP
jgi:hypothetical protein